MYRWATGWRGHSKDEPAVGYSEKKLLTLLRAGRIYIDADTTTLGTKASRVSPTGAISETVQRGAVTLADNAVLVSGTLEMVALGLEEGDLITNISFLSGTTAMVTPTHQQFGLFNSAGVLLAISADATNAAWAANSVKTLALASPYTVLASGQFYVGVVVVAATPPSLACKVENNAAINAIPPIVAGASTAGIAAAVALPFTAAAITAGAAVPYAYLT